MKDIDLINKIYKISDKHNVILKGHIIISRNTNVILFAHYCKSTLFYKDFFNVSKDVLNVNKMANKNLKEAKKIIKNAGYKKVYGDLRPLAVEANFGKWGNNGIIVNDKYGSDFLISAIFYK